MPEKFKYYALRLSGIMIVVFIIQLILPLFTELFLLNSESVFQPWRFFTAIFLHGGVAHLVYNLFALAFFGSVLERIIGGRKFLTVFFVTGILANIISFNFYSSSLGASGAIFGVIGALVIVRPLQTVWAFGLPMPIFMAGIVWAAGDVIGAYGFLTGNPIDNTGNIAHLSGMFFGFILAFIYRTSSKKVKDKIILDEDHIRHWERNTFGV